jgi:hypothetical protein
MLFRMRNRRKTGREHLVSKHLLLVAGSGRSGTSLFSSVVGNLGFHVPRPWVKADDSNPRGFGEPQWVVDRHTQYLRQANVHASDARPTAWADTARLCLDERVSTEVRLWLEEQFSGHERVLIKDPRLLWFLPLWRRVGEELDANVHVVTMLRHPAEVVRSKLHWYHNMTLFDANRAAGWLNTMLFTERATRDHRRAYVRFEDLLEDWTQPIARVSAQLEVPSLVNARAREQLSADSIVDSSLHRSKATWEDLDVPKGLIHLIERVWEDLLSLADPEVDGGDEEVFDRLDAYREEYVSFYRHAEHVAQSTTLAATRPLLQKKSSRAVAAKPSAAARLATARPNRPAGPPLTQPEPAPNSRWGLARRLIPARARNLIPLRVKRALAELFG